MKILYKQYRYELISTYVPEVADAHGDDITFLPAQLQMSPGEYR
jgi:hypothetical protein